MIKIICSIAIVFILTITTLIVVMIIQDGREKYLISAEGLDVPRFHEVDVGFEHFFESSSGLPFMAGAVIDVDNDGVEELFLGGGVRQPDGLFRFEKGHFVDVSDRVGLVKQGDDATLGAVVLDVDHNGFSDIIVTKKSGIWLFRNNGIRFTSERIEADLPPGIVPVGAALVDLNRDGHFDMFVPARNRDSLELGNVFSLGTGEKAASKLLINNGDDSFTDITEAAGVGYGHGGLQAIFLDLDEDGLEDLIVLYSDGRIRTWRNLGSLLFENKKHTLSQAFGLYMGLGVGDYNNDGRMDLFLSNSGSTIPEKIIRADLQQQQKLHSKWVLLENMGDFTFQDNAEQAKLADYQLARGARFVDLNLDGKNDLVVSQNHAFWLPHRLAALRLPGRVLIQNNKGQYVETALASQVENREYSVAPLIADFNGDGYPDIVHVNMDGRSKVFLSEKGENNFLKVRLPDSVESLGAIVSVVTVSGKILKKQFLIGKELCSDSTHLLFFGLGGDKVTDVVVEYTNGKKDHKAGEFFDTTVDFTHQE